MKIFQINSCSNYGSTGRIAVDLARVINSTSNECFLAYGRGTLPEDVNGCQVIDKLGLYKHVLLSRVTDKSGFYSTNETKQLIENIKLFNPDIIHLHNVHGYYVNIEKLFDYINKKHTPIVWTFHDCWPFTGHCAYYDFSHCQKWKTNECYGKCPEKKFYPASYCFSQAHNNFKKKKRMFTSVPNLTIVTPSMWLANEVKKSFLRDYPVQVIPNGVDQMIFKETLSDLKRKFHIENKKIVLGVANYWNQYKGYDDFLYLSNHLSEEYVIVLVGLSQRQISKLSNKIIGIKRTSGIEELVGWYSVANVFVNPTYVDNFPTTNIEALSCGTPVITYKTGGSVEAIDENTGIIVAQGDRFALANAVVDICQQKKPTQACLLHARNFEKGLSFQKYIELYRKILKSKEGESI